MKIDIREETFVKHAVEKKIVDLKIINMITVKKDAKNHRFSLG
jgi:hypothetical protein|tara:strand:+ start:1878 stop:2006 length:129 start_codon:yes stop_codon:yes gene_type:complete